MSLPEMPHHEAADEDALAGGPPRRTSNVPPLPLPTRIAFIGNYLPRQCGIATFTTDLCTAVATEFGSGHLFAIPVNDPDSSYQYPERVRIEITAGRNCFL